MSSPEELLCFLVCQGCLPMVAGEKPTAAPPPSQLLAPAERADKGFTGPGVTMRYPAEGGEVLADYGAELATLTVPEAGLDAAAAALEAAIRSSGRDVQSSEDTQDSRGARARTLFVRVSERRFARITFTLPALGGPPRAAFTVRVAGMAALGHA